MKKEWKCLIIGLFAMIFLMSLVLAIPDFQIPLESKGIAPTSVCNYKSECSLNDEIQDIKHTIKTTPQCKTCGQSPDADFKDDESVNGYSCNTKPYCNAEGCFCSNGECIPCYCEYLNRLYGGEKKFIGVEVEDDSSSFAEIGEVGSYGGGLFLQVEDFLGFLFRQDGAGVSDKTAKVNAGKGADIIEKSLKIGETSEIEFSTTDFYDYTKTDTAKFLEKIKYIFTIRNIDFPKNKNIFDFIKLELVYKGGSKTYDYKGGSDETKNNPLDDVVLSYDNSKSKLINRPLSFLKDEEGKLVLRIKCLKSSNDKITFMLAGIVDPTYREPLQRQNELPKDFAGQKIIITCLNPGAYEPGIVPKIPVNNEDPYKPRIVSTGGDPLAPSPQDKYAPKIVKIGPSGPLGPSKLVCEEFIGASTQEIKKDFKQLEYFDVLNRIKKIYYFFAWREVSSNTWGFEKEGLKKVLKESGNDEQKFIESSFNLPKRLQTKTLRDLSKQQIIDGYLGDIDKLIGEGKFKPDDKKLMMTILNKAIRRDIPKNSVINIEIGPCVSYIKVAMEDESSNTEILDKSESDFINRYLIEALKQSPTEEDDYDFKTEKRSSVKRIFDNRDTFPERLKDSRLSILPF